MEKRYGNPDEFRPGEFRSQVTKQSRFLDRSTEDDDIELYGPDAFLGDNFPVAPSGKLYTENELVEKLLDDRSLEEDY